MQSISPPLLAWFYQNQRSLPFRQEPTPYHVWVSETMLQQTRVSAALPYYERFIRALPDVQALAACPEEKLHKLWEGLGYYSRVRNLQKAAQVVAEQYGGQLPADYDALLALPGIGAYTAGAIGSISFGLRLPAVDGNVLRVFSRLYADEADISLPATKKEFTARVMDHQPADAPGDFNQALMELGALVCLPGTAVRCGECPLQRLCLARAKGSQAGLPHKPPKKARKAEDWTLLVVRGPEGCLLQKRPEKGLLAGLWQPLLLPGCADEPTARATLAALGLVAGPGRELPVARHVFTHREWRLTGWQFAVPGGGAPTGFVWATPGQLRGQYTLPGAFGAYLPYLLGEAGEHAAE